MKFSLSTLLLVLFISGILFSLIGAWQKALQRESLRMQLQKEIISVRASLSIDDKQRQTLARQKEEQFASLAAARRIAEQSFQAMQKRYGTIEPRNSDVLSLRTVPQLIRTGDPNRTVFHLVVPIDRDTWLKYAVVPEDSQNHWTPALDEVSEPPSDSGFEKAGLYALRLPPGAHEISVVSGPAAGNHLPIQILLDQQLLLSNHFTGEGVPSSGAFHVSGRNQLDFGPSQPLPWLHNSRIRLRREGQSSRKAGFVGSLWLSDDPGGFGDFPDPGLAP